MPQAKTQSLLSDELWHLSQPQLQPDPSPKCTLVLGDGAGAAAGFINLLNILPVSAFRKFFFVSGSLSLIFTVLLCRALNCLSPPFSLSVLPPAAIAPIVQ